MEKDLVCVVGIIILGFLLIPKFQNQIFAMYVRLAYSVSGLGKVRDTLF